MSSDHEGLIVYINGEFVPWDQARVHVFSPFAKYGAGVFEGIRGYWSERRGKMLVFRLREHLERLELSQRIMRFEDGRDDPGTRPAKPLFGLGAHPAHGLCRR